MTTALKKSPSVFEKLLEELGLEKSWGYVATEYVFLPGRKFRFDYAWPQRFIISSGTKPLALEVEGGIWTRGRHTRCQGFLGDMEKYNEAVIAGWDLIRCTPSQCADGSILEVLRRLP
jgi:hypothetical protein